MQGWAWITVKSSNSTLFTLLYVLFIFNKIISSSLRQTLYFNSLQTHLHIASSEYFFFFFCFFVSFKFNSIFVSYCGCTYLLFIHGNKKKTEWNHENSFQKRENVLLLFFLKLHFMVLAGFSCTKYMLENV